MFFLCAIFLMDPWQYRLNWKYYSDLSGLVLVWWISTSGIISRFASLEAYMNMSPILLLTRMILYLCTSMHEKSILYFMFAKELQWKFLALSLLPPIIFHLMGVQETRKLWKVNFKLFRSYFWCLHWYVRTNLFCKWCTLFRLARRFEAIYWHC